VVLQSTYHALPSPPITVTGWVGRLIGHASARRAGSVPPGPRW